MSIRYITTGMTTPSLVEPCESQRPIVRIVDRDPLNCSSLRCVLERAGFSVTVFEHVAALANCTSNDAPCCLIIDARQLPKSFDVLDLESQFGTPTIVLVADGTEPPVVVELMKRRAFYVLKKPFAQMSPVVDVVTDAVAYGTERRKGLARKKLLGDTLSSLPEGEREVLGYIVEGYPNKQIASRLGIALRTVEARRARIMRRLSVNSLAELVRSVADQSAEFVERKLSRVSHGSVS